MDNLQGMDLDEALKMIVDDWGKKTAYLTIANKDEITHAGGQIFKDELHDRVKRAHYTHRHNLKYGHMADNIITHTEHGYTDIGWNNFHDAHTARFLNDGTKFIPADHIVTDARQDKDLIKRILNKEKDTLEKQFERGEE